eukprot:scaffold1.g5614.t1
MEGSLEGDGSVRSAGAQTGGECADAGAQWEAPSLSPDERARQLRSPALAAFLRKAASLCEEALQQNELADVLPDGLAGLAEEDAEGPAAAAPAGAGSAPGQGEGLTQHGSFADIAFSLGKEASAVQWHPTRRGVLAVACAARPSARGQPAPAAAAVAKEQGAAGRPAPAHILVWNVRDAVHPEAVLEAPTDVLAFQFHPTQPDLVAAGCATGQVLLWDLTLLDAAPRPPLRAQTAGPAAAGGAGDDGGAGAPAEPGAAAEGAAGAAGAAAKRSALPPAQVSSVDACHQSAVTDLHWLPGLAVTREGKLQAPAPPRPGTGQPPVPAGAAAGAAAAAAECHLFATVAGDGQLLVWDHRLVARARRAGKGEEDAPEWRPALALAALGGGGQPLLCSCLRRDPRVAAGGAFVLGSLEGELARVDAEAYVVEHKGDKEVAHHTVRCAPGRAGCLLALEYSPFFEGVLLGVGQWGFAVWREGASGTARVFESAPPAGGHAGYTCGCWSPSKPGVVLLGRGDGKLEAWNLLDRSHQPELVAAAAPAALTALACADAGGGAGRGGRQVLAVGDASGAVRLVEVPRALRRRGHAEVRQAAALLERERVREERAAELVAERTRAAREAEDARRSAEVAAAAATQAASAPAAAAAAAQEAAGTDDPAATEEQLAEERYHALEAEWRQRLGLAAAVPATGSSRKKMARQANTQKIFEVAYLGLSMLGSWLILRWAIKQMDPHKASKKAAKDRAREISKRIGKTITTDGQYEDVVATEVVNPAAIDVTLADVGGLDHIVDDLKRNIITPMQRPELFRRRCAARGGMASCRRARARVERRPRGARDVCSACTAPRAHRAVPAPRPAPASTAPRRPALRRRSSLLRQKRGVLLYGPPGTGKTMLAKALAKQCGACFINLKASTLLSKWFGDTNKVMRGRAGAGGGPLGRAGAGAAGARGAAGPRGRGAAGPGARGAAEPQARPPRPTAPAVPASPRPPSRPACAGPSKMVAAVWSLAYKIQPAIIFIDEVDSLLGERKAMEHEATTAMKTEFMQLWEGFETSMSSNIVVLGATNKRDALDDAVLRRFSLQYEVKLPDMWQREAILRITLQKHANDIGADKVHPSLLPPPGVPLLPPPPGADDAGGAAPSPAASSWASAGSSSSGGEADGAGGAAGPARGTSMLRHLAATTEGYSGSDLNELCSQAAVIPIHEALQRSRGGAAGPGGGAAPVEPLSWRHFERVLEDFTPPSRAAQQAVQQRRGGAGAPLAPGDAVLLLQQLAGALAMLARNGGGN